MKLTWLNFFFLGGEGPGFEFSLGCVYFLSPEERRGLLSLNRTRAGEEVNTYYRLSLIHLWELIRSAVCVLYKKEGKKSPNF